MSKASPLETDPAWVSLQGIGGGPEGIAYFVQAYNEFFIGLEMGISGHRQQPTAKCPGLSLSA